MTNHCPFCGNYAYAAPVGDAYRLDCRYCEIQVEITKRAYAARCPNPVAVLDYIRKKMEGSIRPRVDIADMKRATPPPAFEEEMNNKQNDGDALTTAAKAIGTTLGKLAVRTGIATPPVKIQKTAAAKPAKKKTPAAKKATGVKAKAAKKAAPKRTKGK